MLNIDDDVLLAAKEIAKAQNTTVGKAISDLAGKALGAPSPLKFESRHGFAVLPPRGGRVTPELVDRLMEDEDP